MKPGVLLAGALLLAGCAPRTAPAATAPAVPVTQISGDITRWAGQGSVTLAGPAGQVLARAEVTPGGRFTLPLPTGEAVTPLLRAPADALASLGCTGSVLSSAAARGYAFFGLTPQGGGPERTVFAAQAVRTAFTSGAFSGRAYLYVDQATRLSGTVDCGPIVQQFAGVQAAVPVAVDILAQPGWNALELAVDVQVGFSGANAGGRLSAVADTGRVWRTSDEVVQQVLSN